jgi:hypothetical protein
VYWYSENRHGFAEAHAWWKPPTIFYFVRMNFKASADRGMFVSILWHLKLVFRSQNYKPSTHTQSSGSPCRSCHWKP